MRFYIYQADIICEDCAVDFLNGLRKNGCKDTGDSDDYPQGPFESSLEESDSPQHCGQRDDCINAESYPGLNKGVGLFLENALTTDGMDYVKNVVKANPNDTVAQLWGKFYGVPNSRE
jgi:hypothetical protein